MTQAPPPAGPGPTLCPSSPDDAIEAIATRWTGRFHNHRQVCASEARGGPPQPELTRERRRLEVDRLDAPQLGATVLYLQEFRASGRGLAHRQRVTVLRLDPDAGLVRAEQLFFAEGPAYDRPPLEAAAVARLPPGAFRRYPGCDLFFRHEPELDRWRGAMRPGACVYPHPLDGQVCADFEMLLHADQLWYRDRSVRVADGTVRGEVDGFSWLLFDRLGSPALRPALLAQEGVWRGRFRRCDAAGTLLEEVPSEIVLRVLEREGATLVHQSNVYRPLGGPEQRIESHGEVRDGRLWFAGDRLEGWAMDLPPDVAAGGCLLVLRPRDGVGPEVHEILSLSPDGRRRFRSAQLLRQGVLVGRTLIEEEKVSDDWRAWDAAPGPEDLGAAAPPA